MKYKELKKQTNTFKGKINFVIYMANWILLVVHFLYLIFYINIKAYLLLVICLVSTIIYGYYLIKGIENHKRFGIESYILILIHTVLATFILGWKPGYYQWLYALICAYFLPSFGADPDEDVKRPIYMGIIFTITFYILATFTNSGMVKPFITLNGPTIRILFSINAFLVFFTIMMFTYFYTTREQIKENDLKQKAEFDALTGLRNRYAINKIIDSRIQKNEEFSIAIIDIDLFKNINDRYGHDIGDFILKELSKKIKELENYEVVSARWGGEEFILLGPSNMSFKNFIGVLEEFRRTIRNYKFISGKNKIGITISIGISEHKINDNIKSSIKKADEKLYEAKENGRNRVVY